ncbi:MAG: hypothetical protein LBP58_06975 [Azoarcus sp.]|jgi:hypothetical protein|nr:hypothetical protein [Azoarcus sp.]
MAVKIRLHRGVKANIPQTGHVEGEPVVTTNTHEFYIGKADGTLATLTPDPAKLATLAVIDGEADLVPIFDASEGGQKQKTVTFDDFKAALNIPVGSTDEHVAPYEGGEAGTLGGSDGTNGVLRTDSSLSLSIDADSGALRLSVVAVDGGTFS